MSSKNKRKGKKKSQNAQTKLSQAVLPQTPLKKPSLFIRWLDKYVRHWKIFAGCVVVINFSLTFYEKCIKSEKQKAYEEATWQGYLKPPPITPTPTYKSTATTSEGLPIYLSVKSPVFTNSTTQGFPHVKGIHIVNFNPNKAIHFILGSQQFSLEPEFLYKGVELLSTGNVGCSDTKLIIGLKDNRLYVSTEFKSLANEETAGVIDFNHWTVFKTNVLSFPQENDTTLEVRDKQNKIIFAIKYQTNMRITNYYMNAPIESPKNAVENMDAVIINGYFLGDTSITILNPVRLFMTIETPKVSGLALECIKKSEPDWKTKASIKISQIRSIFPN